MGGVLLNLFLSFEFIAGSKSPSTLNCNIAQYELLSFKPLGTLETLEFGRIQVNSQPEQVKIQRDPGLESQISIKLDLKGLNLISSPFAEVRYRVCALAEFHVCDSIKVNFENASVIQADLNFVLVFSNSFSVNCSYTQGPRKLSGTSGVQYGRVNVDHTVTRVSFTGTFSNPVVIAMVVTQNDKSHVTCRVKNVNSTGFDVFLQAPSGSSHSASEDVGYFAVDLSNPPQGIEGGTVMTNKDSGHLRDDYSAENLILNFIQTSNNDQIIVTDTYRYTDHFHIYLDDLEGSSIEEEKVGWIAILPGAYDFGSKVEFGKTETSSLTPQTKYLYSKMLTIIASVNLSGMGSNPGYLRGHLNDKTNETNLELEHGSTSNLEEVSWVGFIEEECYYVHKVCQDFCPSGFYLSSGNCESDSTLVFRLTPRQIQDIVNDNSSNIPVYTGEDSSFYPNYKPTDPWAAYMRGYYFTGSSYMRFPDSSEYEFTLAPDFTITAWVRPDSDSNTQILLSKTDQNGKSMIEFSIDSENPKLNVVLRNLESFTSSSSHSIEARNWNFIGAKGYTGANNYFTIKMIVNLNANSEATSSQKSFYYDVQSNYKMTIGAELGYENHFKGFLYELRIYNENINTDTLITSSCEDDCAVCPDNGNCIVSCDIDELWTGTSYNSCSSCGSCSQGCVRSENCNLCQDELCQECTGFNSSCLTCKEHSTNQSGVCKCNTGYFKNNDICSECTPNCDECSSEGLYNCLKCSDGYYLVQGVCSSECPTDYTCSPTNSTVPGLIFHLNPSKIEDTVYDLKNLIPVLTGEDDQFYPQYGTFDPYPAKDRGYYFNESYMQTSGSPLSLSPFFSIFAWIKPASESGVVFSKDQLKLSLENYSPKLELGGVSLTGPSLDQSSWNLVGIKTYPGTLEVWANSTKASKKTNEFFQGKPSSLTIGGANSGFKGFLWDLKIYNSVTDPPVETNCKDCTHCPIELKGTCLPNCGINTYWNGTLCLNCSSECQSRGCVRQDTSCNLCGDQQCYKCSDYQSNCSECIENAQDPNDCKCSHPYYWEVQLETCVLCPEGTYLDLECTPCPSLCLDCDSQEVCTGCVPNASLTNESSCECTEGFKSFENTCEKDYFYANLYVKENNYLNLTFTSPPSKNLTSEDCLVTLQNQNPGFSIERRSNQSYFISINFDNYVTQNQVVELEFTLELRDQDNKFLYNKSLKGELYEFDPNRQKEEQGARIGSNLVMGALGAGIAASSVNPNPAGLWAIINCVQILHFVPMSTNPLTPMLKEFFKALNQIELIPNIFEYVVDPKSYPNKHKESFKYGYESSSFLLNAGENLSVIGVIILLFPFIWGISKIPLKPIQRKFSSLLEEYKHGIFMRFWVTAYLEICISAVLQFYNFLARSVFEFIDFLCAVGFGVLLVASPYLIFKFVLKRKREIAMLSEQSAFYKIYGSLFYEFRVTSGSIARYSYIIYILRRLLYSCSLFFLSPFPIVQAIANILISLTYWVYLLVVRPFSESILQVCNCISEFGILGIFCLVTYFLLEDRNHDEEFESVILYTDIAIVFIQILASVLVFLKVVYELVREKVSKTIPVLEELNQNTPAPPETVGTQECRELDFFRRKPLK